MVMRKWASRILIAAFILILCFSWLWWILLGRYVDSSNHENRNMSVRPSLSLDNYETFPQEYEEYFNDNIPFRNNLITLNSAIDYFVFHQSSNKRVIVGQDNWLFYSDVKDGDPIGCYKGENLYTEEELQMIAENCMSMQRFLNEQGKEFLIFIAPNKERIYSEKMPEWYGRPAETYRALQVAEYLQNNTNVRVIYPYKELMEAKKCLSENIWYKTDTHWNWVGGYIGASALLSELDVKVPSILSEEITISSGGDIAGDLANMVGLKKMLKHEDSEYTVIGYKEHNVQTITWDFNNAIIYHAENADERKIYVCRDSFSTHMSKYIGSQFNDSYLRHVSTYSYDDFIEQDPDIFVYETVERYIDRLSSFSIQ